MAKEDFCFTYYDGDAARDKAHLDRLGRGAYDDIISAQRKFGHLTVDVIKRVLGSDFATCWPPIEWIMKVDSDGKYYLEWLESSIQKMRASSKKQQENISKRWKGKDNNIPNEYQKYTMVSENNTMDIPLENENEYVNTEEDKEGMGEKGEEAKKAFPQFPNEENLAIELPDLKIGSVIELLAISKKQKLVADDVNRFWHVFKVQNFTGKKYYADVGDVYSHFINWMKTQNVSDGKQNTGNNGQQPKPHIPRASQGAMRILGDLKADYGITDQG